MYTVIQASANPMPSSEAPTAERRIPCRAGIRPQRNSPQNEVFVQSPRTGMVLVIGDGWYPELRAKAPRLIGRITQACSVGQRVVELTVAELRAFSETYTFIQEKCRPRPRTAGVYSNYRIKPGRRRGWINR